MKNFTNPHKSAVTLLTTFPVFILIVLALVLEKPQRTTDTDLIERHYLLETLIVALPVPRGMIQTAIVAWLYKWLYDQVNLMTVLHQTGQKENFWLPS